MRVRAIHHSSLLVESTARSRAIYREGPARGPVGATVPVAIEARGLRSKMGDAQQAPHPPQ
jgi:hypothetical protein